MTDRVLIVEQAPGVGGSTIALARLLKRLDRNRFEPIVAVQCEEQTRHLRAAGLAGMEIVEAPVVGGHVLPAPARRGIASRAARLVPGLLRLARRHGPAAATLRRVARDRGVRLVHLNNTLSANVGGFWTAWRLGLPCVVKQRGYEWDSADIRWASRRVSCFLADSEHVAADLQRLGIQDERIVVNYAPIDLEPFDTAVDRGAARAELGIPHDAPAFGIVGCLQPWKGQDVFLAAAARVIARRTDAVALVVGGGGEHFDRTYERRLRARAQDLGIAARVQFTGHRDDIARILAALDVCVHASLEAEPFGMVVGEAMAARRPVVASREGGPAEQIEEGRSGFLVAPGDAEALAERIVRLLGDPELRAAMGERGREIVESRFTSQRHAEATAAAYERALST